MASPYERMKKLKEEEEKKKQEQKQERTPYERMKALKESEQTTNRANYLGREMIGTAGNVIGNVLGGILPGSTSSQERFDRDYNDYQRMMKLYGEMAKSGQRTRDQGLSDYAMGRAYQQTQKLGDSWDRYASENITVPRDYRSGTISSLEGAVMESGKRREYANAFGDEYQRKAAQRDYDAAYTAYMEAMRKEDANRLSKLYDTDRGAYYGETMSADQLSGAIQDTQKKLATIKDMEENMVWSDVGDTRYHKAENLQKRKEELEALLAQYQSGQSYQGEKARADKMRQIAETTMNSENYEEMVKVGKANIEARNRKALESINEENYNVDDPDDNNQFRRAEQRRQADLKAAGYISDIDSNYIPEDVKPVYYALFARDPSLAQEFAAYWKEIGESEYWSNIYEQSGKNTGSRARAFIEGTFANTVAGLDPFGEGGQYAAKLGRTMIGGGAAGLSEKGLFNTGALAGEIDMPLLGKKSLGDAYQLGSSMLQSGANAFVAKASGGLAPIVAAAGTILLGSSAAASDYQEKVEQGWDENSAKWHAIAAGTAEAAFEYLSIDKLVNQDITRGFIKNFLVQGGIEASEEAFTTIANRISDSLTSEINGYDNNIERRQKELMAKGYEYGTAEKMAQQEWLTELLNDAFGGFVSGGIMSSGQYAMYPAYKAMGAVETRRQNERAGANVRLTEQTEALQQYANDNNLEWTSKEGPAESVKIDESGAQNAENNIAGSTLEQQLSDAAKQTPTRGEIRKQSKQDRALGADARRVQEHIVEQMTGKTVEEKQALRDELVTKYGESIAPTVYEAITSETARQAAKLADVDAIRAARNEAMKGIKDAEMKRAVVEGYDSAAYTKALRANDEAQVGRYYQQLRNSGAGEMSMEAIVKGEDGTEQKVGITGMTEDGKRVKLADGSTVAVRDLQADADTADAVQRIARMDLGANADAVLKAYRESGVNGADGYRWLMDYTTAFEQGRTNRVSLEQAVKQSSLDAKTVMQAYELGQKESHGETQRRMERAKNAPKKQGVTGRTANIDTSEVEGKTMNASELEQFDFANKVFSLIGVNLKWFSSEEDNGKYKGKNGAYENGTVYMDIHAGRNFVTDINSGILATTGHELTHFLQQYAPQEYQTLKEFLFRQIAEKRGEQTLERLIWEKQRRSGYTISKRVAEDEVVADACQTMLRDSKALREFARENESAAKRLIRWLDEWFTKLKDIFSRSASFSEEARFVNSLEADIRKAFGDLWDTALREAVRTHDEVGDMKNPATEGGEQYELREFEDGTRFVDVQTDQNIFDGLSLSEMTKKAVKIIKTRFSGKVIGLDNRAFVNGSSADEYGHPSRDISDDLREAKMRASTEIDNIVDAGRNRRNIPDGADGHYHPQAVGGFDHLDTIFKIGPEYFSGRVNFEKNKRGYRFKDLTKLKNITQDIVSSYGKNPKSRFLRDVSMDSIREEIKNVKGEEQNSDRDYNQTVVLTEQTVDKYLADYAAKSSPNYAQAYIVQMRPDDFLSLTTSKAGLDRIYRETGELDVEKLKDASIHQPFQLRIDSKTGQVEGHEGRHRAMALGNNGIRSIPVLLFDSSNKYSKTAMDQLTLTGQDFGSSRSNATVTVQDVQPLSYANRDNVVQKFTTQPSLERISEKYGDTETIRYSDRDTEYLELAKDPEKNRERLQEMVDERAREAGAMTLPGGKRKPYYHGTAAKFTSFDINKSGDGTFGYGFYFTPVKSFAQGYGPVKSYYIMTDRIATWEDHRITPEQVLQIRSEYGLKTGENDVAKVAKWLENTGDSNVMLSLESAIKRNTNVRPAEFLQRFREVFGYDGLRQARETVLFDNRLIKSADPVTYDDSGNVIPLSERFNTENQDIRYSQREQYEEAVEASDVLTRYSLREEPAPQKTIKAYKAFYVKDGKLYPPMVSNNTNEEDKQTVKKASSGTMKGLETPVGVWLDADVGGIAVDENGVPLRTKTTGRLQVQNDKGGGTLAFRPGWHLGEWPDASQFNVKDPVTGALKSVMPDNLVFAECEIAADVDYQLEAYEYGISDKGGFSRTQAGLPRVPTNGYYKYRTNVDPTTAPWYITGAMKVTRILSDEERRQICNQFGVTPQERASHKDIDLEAYGLKAGPVKQTENLERFRKNKASYDNDALLKAALEDENYSNAYVRRTLDFDNETLAKEFELDRISPDQVKKYRESYQSPEVMRSERESAANANVSLDFQSESAAPSDGTLFSERTWTASRFVQDRENAAKALAKALDVTQKQAEKYIDDINSVAKAIADDRARLDYMSSPGRSAFKSNAEYGGSIDFSTLCKKRQLLTGTFNAIQHALANTVLTAEDVLRVRQMMQDAGLEVNCGMCYVEGSRARMGEYNKTFLELYKKYFPDNWQPKMEDVNTTDGLELMRMEHPECYEQYEHFYNNHGTLRSEDKAIFSSQAKPKEYQLRTEYKGEIKDKFQNETNVDAKNRNGGMRMQSFSDFEIVHLIDCMQVIMDMSEVGLAGQAYTKVPEFAEALGRTGLKINLSLVAKGVDENGKLIFNDVEGMPHKRAFGIREKYSENVGTILVVYDDAQLVAAMADDKVDFIIPFHRSQWRKSQYAAMGLPKTTKDYTYQQNEKWLNPKEHTHKYRDKVVPTKCTNYMPNEYWDFSLSGAENARRYLEMCAKDGKRPKFYKLLQNNGDGSFSLKADGSTDGYWKLLIDFKMYDNNGVGVPQMPVQPIFDMDNAMQMLDDYSGDPSRFPVAEGIVDEFVRQYKAEHPGRQYSMRDYANVEQLSPSEIMARNAVEKDRVQEVRDRAANSTEWQGRPILAYEGAGGIHALTGSHRLAVARLAGYDVNAVVLREKELADLDRYLQDETYWDLDDFLEKMDEADQAEILHDAVANGYKSLEEASLLMEEEIESNNARYSMRDYDNTLSDYDLIMGIDEADVEGADPKAQLRETKQRITRVQSLRNKLADTRAELKAAEKKIAALKKKDGTFKQAVRASTAEAALARERINAKGWEDIADRTAKQLDKTIKEKRALENKLAKQLQREEDILAGKLKPLAMQRMLKDAREAQYKEDQKAKEAQFAGYKDRKNRTAIRNRIKNLHAEMNRDLLRPREGHFVPEKLILPVVDLLDLVNTETNRAKSESAQARIAAINAAYDAIKKDERYSQFYDETVKDMLVELSGTLAGRSIYDLTTAELEDVYTVMKAMRTTIRNTIKADLIEKGREAWEIGNALRQELRSGRGAHANGLLEKYHMTMLSAKRAFNRFGGYMPDSTWNKVYRMLDDAQLRMLELEMQGTRIFDAVLQSKENIKKAEALTKYDEKSLVDVGLKDEAGEAVPITRGMMLALYMHLQNEENMRHLMYGGLTLPDYRRYYKGDAEAWGKGSVSIPALGARVAALDALFDKGEISEAEYDEAYRENKEEIDEILDSVRTAIEKQLTDYDRQWIAASKEFFDGFSRRELNRVTNEMYGFSKAKVDNYFPIVTDKNFLKNEFDSISRNISLENAGFMKERVRASNPILLEDLTRTVNRQISNVSRYAGLTQALKTFGNVYNVQSRGFTDSVKKAMAKTYGTNGQKYVENLITDMIGGRTTPGTIFDKIKGNYAQAVLAANLSVTIKQAASYPTAAATVGWGPILKALAKGGKSGRVISRADSDLIGIYSPLLWYRSKGAIDVEIGDIANGRDWTQRAQWLMGWIEKTDRATVGRLWYAAEYYVKANYNLEKGTEAQIKNGESPFYRKVAEVFSDIVEDTQPNYTVLQRPDILRNPNKLVRAMVMFSTQRFQNGNILIDAIAEYNAMRRADKQNSTAQTQAARKAAKAKLTNAISSQVVSAVVLNVMTLVSNALMHRMNPWRDDDDEITAESIGEEMLNGFLSSMAGSFLAGSELYEAISSLLTGSKYYGNDVGGISTVNELATAVVEAGQKAEKLIQDENSKPEDWKRFAEKQLAKVGEYLAQMTGVPIANVNKIISGGKNHIIDAINGEFGSFEAGLERTNTVNARRFYLAWQEGDEAKMDRILQDVRKSGSDPTGVFSKLAKEAYVGGDISIDEYADLLWQTGLIERKKINERVIDLLREDYQNGLRSAEDTTKLLIKYGEKVETEDDAWKVLQRWETTAEHAGEKDYHYSEFENFYEDLDAGQDFSDAAADYMDHGYEEKNLRSNAVGHLKERYKAGDLTEDEAIDLLIDYSGKDEDYAWKAVQKWLGETEHEGEEDYSWSQYDALDAAIDKNDDIRSIVAGLTDHGVKEESVNSHIKSYLLDRFMDGSLSDTALKNKLSRYCGIVGDDANRLVRWKSVQKANPNLEITESQCNSWYDGSSKSRENGHESAKAAGMSIEAYLKAKAALDPIKDQNGNNTGEDEFIAALGKMTGLTSRQKDALYYERYKGTTKYSRKTW